VEFMRYECLTDYLVDGQFCWSTGMLFLRFLCEE
jgi:hypothetical protein